MGINILIGVLLRRVFKNAVRDVTTRASRRFNRGTMIWGFLKNLIRNLMLISSRGFNYIIIFTSFRNWSRR